jgi:hypothetical protein
MVKRFGPGASMIRQPWKAPIEDCRQEQPVLQKQNSKPDNTGEPSLKEHGRMVAKEDTDMEQMTSTLSTTSLGLVPPSVTRKQKKRDPNAQFNPGSNSLKAVNREAVPHG